MSSSGPGPGGPFAAQPYPGEEQSPESDAEAGTLSRLLNTLGHPREYEVDRLIADLRHLSRHDRTRLAEGLQRVLRDDEASSAVARGAGLSLAAAPRLRRAGRAIDIAVVVIAVAISVSVIVLGLQVDLTKPPSPAVSAEPAPSPPLSSDDQVQAAARLPAIEPAAGDAAAPNPSAAPSAAAPPVQTATLEPANAPPAAALAAPGPAATAPAAPVDEPVGNPLPPEDIAILIQRGDEFMRQGDIASARVFYERAAQGGNAAAATSVGKTYDPIYLAEMGVVGVRGDPAQAAIWYRRAADAGDRTAVLRLKALGPRLPK